MKTLATCRHLKTLRVVLKDRRQGYSGPTGLSHLVGLHSLEQLAIQSGDPLPDADLGSLESLAGLKDLSISGPPGWGISDRGLASLGKLKQLERLDLSTETRSGLNHLNGLSHLQYLQVTNLKEIDAGTGGPIDELALDLSGLTQMRDLNLTGLPLHDADLACLGRLPRLESLMIQPSSPLTGASLRYLQGLPQLHRLWVFHLSNCTGQDLSLLGHLPNLRELRLAGDLTDAALASFMGPPSLNSLIVETDRPLRKETAAQLTKRHPGIESIHISTLPQTPPRLVGPAQPPRVVPPRR